MLYKSSEVSFCYEIHPITVFLLYIFFHIGIARYSLSKPLWTCFSVVLPKHTSLVRFLYQIFRADS